MPRGIKKRYRGWFSKESAQRWANDFNKEEKKMGGKLKCHVKKNPAHEKNPKTYPYLTWVEVR